jgi:hypothetical protein
MRLTRSFAVLAAVGLLVSAVLTTAPGAQAAEPIDRAVAAVQIVTSEPVATIEAAVYHVVAPDTAIDDAAAYARTPAAVGKIGPNDPDEDGESDDVRFASLDQVEPLADTDVGWRTVV